MHCSIIPLMESSWRGDLKVGTMIDGTYQVVKIIGSGCRGKVYQCLQLSSGEEVAMKIEWTDNPTESQPLERDIKLLKKMEGVEHFPNLFGVGVDTKLRLTYIGMSLLGLNLFELKGQRPTNCFGLEDGLKIGIQMLDILRSLHDVGFIHGNVKPENFTVGKESTDIDHVYVIDFGNSERYRTKVEVDQQIGRKYNFFGTPLYASVYALDKKSHGRRDDLYYLLYSLIVLITGDIPWRWNPQDVYYDDLIKRKMTISDDELLKDIPLRKFLAHLKELEEFSEPNYELIRAEMVESLSRLQSPSSSGYGSSLQLSPETTPTTPTITIEKLERGRERGRDEKETDDDIVIRRKYLKLDFSNLYPDVISDEEALLDFWKWIEDNKENAFLDFWKWIGDDEEKAHAQVIKDEMIKIPESIPIAGQSDPELPEPAKKKLSKSRRILKFLRRFCCCCC